jgi:hypothetical protein
MRNRPFDKAFQRRCDKTAMTAARLTQKQADQSEGHGVGNLFLTKDKTDEQRDQQDKKFSLQDMPTDSDNCEWFPQRALWLFWG